MTLPPPMPAFTTAYWLPYSAWTWRANTSGQRSSPLMVEAVPSVIEVAECHDRLGAGRRTHVQFVEEIPGRGRIGERLFSLVRGFGAAVWWADVGGGQCLGVPGHRSAVAADVEGDSEAAAGQHFVVGVSDEGQRDGVADGGGSGGDGDLGFGAKGDGAVGAGDRIALPLC